MIMRKIEDRFHQIRIPQFISIKIEYTSLFLCKDRDLLMMFLNFFKNHVHTFYNFNLSFLFLEEELSRSEYTDRWGI